MDKIGYIEIHIEGFKGNFPISPATYDIREIINTLEHAEHLLFPNEQNDRPPISYQLEEGSVRHIFKTSMQAIIGFNALLAQIEYEQSIDFLEINTAKAIEAFQNAALKKSYTFTILTSLSDTRKLIIDKNSHFLRTESIWADAEFYLYGKITNAGGKDKANIHLVTEEMGTLRIQTPKEFLERIEDNLLYRTFGIRAVGKQNIETGELDKSSLRFVELINYKLKYDEIYLKGLRKKAKSWLSNVDPDEWLREIRGGYDV